jgi:methylated-DNA-[protein]-cysteine S-methyltransferase
MVVFELTSKSTNGLTSRPFDILLLAMLQAIISSPIGPLRIVIENDAIIRLTFEGGEMLDFSIDSSPCSLPEPPPAGLREPSQQTLPESDSEERLLAQTVVELAEYFQGKRQLFSLPVRLYGTEFQRRTWKLIEAIPFGAVRSYADIACELGRPKALRAVGSACRWNPVAIIVPCHRVTGSNGKLTGYNGGLRRKDFLLKLERKPLPLHSRPGCTEAARTETGIRSPEVCPQINDGSHANLRHA